MSNARTLADFKPGTLGALATKSAVAGADITDLSVNTADLADASVTPAKQSQPLTRGTAQATTSGTAVDFTGIPSWVKRITVMLNGVSLSGTSSFVALQLGAGSVVTTGYSASSTNMSGTVTSTTFTQGFGINGGAAANAYNGHFICTNVTGNVWVVTGMFQTSGAVNAWTSVGSITLSGTLDRVRLASTSTDTFDAGSVNILYE